MRKIYKKNNEIEAILSKEPREVNSGLIKFKPREVEATLCLNFIYFKTGTTNSFNAGLFNEDIENPQVFIDVTNSGLTKVSFEPSYGYYISGGGMKIISDDELPTYPITVGLTLAPLVDEEYGGNVRLVYNKKFFKIGDKFEIVTPSKYVKYYDYMPIANAIEFDIEHDPSDQIYIECYLTIYKN